MEEGKAQKHMVAGPRGGHAKITTNMVTAGEVAQDRGLWRTIVDGPLREQHAKKQEEYQNIK